MSPLAPGTAVPPVTLEGPEGPVRLDELPGDGPLLILFYQEDATPLCTAQLCAFRDDWEMLSELGAHVVAISADAPESHRAFAERENLPFPLLADPDLEAARAFDVVDETGKRSIRAAFVADTSGTITAAFPYYSPSNLNQYQAIFEALGLDL